MHLSSVEDRRGRCRRPPLPPIPPLHPPPPHFLEWGGMQGGGGEESGGGRRLHLPHTPNPFPWRSQGMKNPPRAPLEAPTGPPWVLMGTPPAQQPPSCYAARGGAQPPSCIPPLRGGGRFPPPPFAGEGARSAPPQAKVKSPSALLSFFN
nr:hypothetical protein [Morchella crassipes]